MVVAEIAMVGLGRLREREREGIRDWVDEGEEEGGRERGWVIPSNAGRQEPHTGSISIHPFLPRRLR